MRKIGKFLGVLTYMLLLLFLCFSFSNSPSKRIVTDFSLQNVNGRLVSLKDYPNAKGFIIVFTCNHCPFAKLYPARFNDMNTKYAPLGVPLLAISSSDTIMYDEDVYFNMVQKSEREHFLFPYLYDKDQIVAKNFHADRTPHAFVIWKEKGKWIVKYNGAIDNNGAAADLVTQHFVTDAVDALLQGKPVKVSETKSLGCQIHFRN